MSIIISLFLPLMFEYSRLNICCYLGWIQEISLPVKLARSRKGRFSKNKFESENNLSFQINVGQKIIKFENNNVSKILVDIKSIS